MLVRTSASTAIANLETGTARKTLGTIEGSYFYREKLPGSATARRCIGSGEISGGVTHNSGDAGL